MPAPQDPTKDMMKAASALSEVVEGTSCSQSFYKVGKKAFLYVGPGPKGIGFKAMFKLGPSTEAAGGKAKSDSKRIEIGVGNWVTARFTAEEPLLRKIWSRWLNESYAQASGS